MNFKPLYDRILVQRAEKEDKSKGGLFLPETAKEKPMEGVVISVGVGHRKDSGGFTPLALQVGERCLFGKYAGDEIKLNGEDYIILREEDVLAVLS